MSHDFWSVVLISGLLGWLYSSIMLILKAFPRRDVFDASNGIRWGTAGIVSFIVWITGMLYA